MTHKKPTRRARYSVIRELADKARDAYLAVRSDWLPGAGPVSSRVLQRWSSTWEKMANFFLANGIRDYQLFIRWQFESQRNQSCCLAPDHCYGPAALSRWRVREQNLSARIEELALSRQLQQTYLVREFSRICESIDTKPVSATHLDEMVLFSEDSRLSSLFRYCVAVEAGYSRVSESFFVAATSQYATDAEAYDAAWGDWIPDNIRERYAERLVASEMMEDGSRED